jgi:hypothetical protein
MGFQPVMQDWNSHHVTSIRLPFLLTN